MRSRTLSLPLSRWRLSFSGPPMARASAWRRRNSSISGCQVMTTPLLQSVRRGHASRAAWRNHSGCGVKGQKLCEREDDWADGAQRSEIRDRRPGVEARGAGRRPRRGGGCDPDPGIDEDGDSGVGARAGRILEIRVAEKDLVGEGQVVAVLET